MDGNRFDDLSRRFAGGVDRRTALKVAGGGLLAAIGLGRRDGAAAQVSQGQCGNKVCKTDPGVCNDACVCCVHSNGNSRCRPADKCIGEIVCPPGEQFCPNLNRCAVCCVDADCPAANACEIPVCQNGACFALVNFCNDNNPCTQNACDPVTGCSNTPLSDTACGASGDQICCNGACCDAGFVCDPAVGCVECLVDGDCPTSDDPCQRTSCAGGFCLSSAANDGVQCGLGKTCIDGVCAGNGLCAFGALTGCDDVAFGCGGGNCGCRKTVEGGAICAALSDASNLVCETSSDCSADQICTPTCFGPRCAFIC